MFIWLTVIVRLLRGTRQASGGRHFEDFTYRSSLRNAFITFQSLIIPFSPQPSSIGDLDLELKETGKHQTFSNALCPARKSRDQIDSVLLRSGLEDGRRGLLPIYFQAVPSGQVFPLTARHASSGEFPRQMFHSFPREIHASWNRRHPGIFHAPFYNGG